MPSFCSSITDQAIRKRSLKFLTFFQCWHDFFFCCKMSYTVFILRIVQIIDVIFRINHTNQGIHKLYILLCQSHPVYLPKDIKKQANQLTKPTLQTPAPYITFTFVICFYDIKYFSPWCDWNTSYELAYIVSLYISRKANIFPFILIVIFHIRFREIFPTAHKKYHTNWAPFYNTVETQCQHKSCWALVSHLI